MFKSLSNPSKKGELHRYLRVPPHKKLPISKLKKCATSQSKYAARCRIVLVGRGYRKDKRSNAWFFQGRGSGPSVRSKPKSKRAHTKRGLRLLGGGCGMYGHRYRLRGGGCGIYRHRLRLRGGACGACGSGKRLF